MSVAPHSAPEPDSASRDPSPDYISELWHEVLSFLSTLWGLCRHPIAFHREWVNGRREAMNPVAFFGVCYGLQSGISLLQYHATNSPQPDPGWWYELVGGNLELVVFVAYGVVAYTVLRRRKVSTSMRATLGAVLFSFAASELVLSVVDDLMRVAAYLLHVDYPGRQISFALLVPLFLWITFAIAGASNRGLLVSIEAILSPLIGLVGVVLLGGILFAGFLFVVDPFHARENAVRDGRKALLRPAAIALWDAQKLAADAGTVARAVPAVDAGTPK